MTLSHPTRTAALLLTCLTPMLAATPPRNPATAPAPNAITGTLQLPAHTKILRLIAIDRTLADVQKLSPLSAHPDPTLKDPAIYEAILTSANDFHIDKLLPNHTYDLILWTATGGGGGVDQTANSPAAPTQEIRWEGVAMDYHREIIPSTEITPEDRKNIETLVTDVSSFYDKTRILRLAADHQHATALVELIRTRDFDSNAGGEIIYRVELWYFENLFGGWAKENNTEKPLERLRGKPDTFPETWQFLPNLGSLIPGSTPLTLTLPDTPDKKRGLAGRIR